MNRFACVAFTLLVAGCGGDTRSLLPLDEPLRLTGDAAGQGTVRAHLQSPLGITAGHGPMVLESFRPTETDLRFAPGRTTIDLTRAESVMLTGASIALGDLHLTGGPLPPAGLDLLDLTLVLKDRTRTEVVRSESDLLTIAGTATFELKWKLELEDGTPYALGPVELGPFELHAAARRGPDEAPTLELLLLCPGACGEVPGLFALSDAAADVTLPVALEAR